MPIYSYKCSSCGDLYEPFLDVDAQAKAVMDSGNMVCFISGCWGQYKRKFSFAHHDDGFGDGYMDYSVGAFVRNKRELDDINKARSAAASERLGIEHRFVAKETMDLKPPDVEA